MCIRERFYEIDNEWCVIHLPKKPSGFAIILLGNIQNYVEKNNVFWLNHEGRNGVLETLREAGYTIICSNLYGKHWGSEQAVSLAKYCYHFLNKTETVNPKVHIIAEGIGAFLALEIAEQMQYNIRTLCLIDPIISIQNECIKEKKNKLYYKKFQKELKRAYGKKENDSFVKLLSSIEERTLNPFIPTKIYSNTRNIEASTFFKTVENDYNNISLAYYVTEAKYQTLTNMIRFFKENEKEI